MAVSTEQTVAPVSAFIPCGTLTEGIRTVPPPFAALSS
jgi:hypothetical protein